MIIRLIFFFLVIFTPTLVLGQIVTASFDRSTLCINPSAATSRGYSQLALFASQRTIDSDITEQRSDSQTFPWEEKIKVNKVGIYFTGHGRITPELYISKDSADKTLMLKDVGSEENNVKTDLINNLFNLGMKFTNRLALGFKIYAPSYEIKEDYTVDYGDGETVAFSAQSESKMLGIGAGLTYHLMDNFFVGGYYSKITEKTKADLNFTDVDGIPQNTVVDDDFTRNQFGLGVSILKGGRGRGFRFEAAYSMSDNEEALNIDRGEEVYAAVELSHRFITFGVNVKYRKNMYFDNIELIDYIIGDKVFSEEFKPAYGGFVSFGSGRGHTIGVSGFAYSSTGEKKLFGQDQKAKVQQQQVTLNYAYLF